MNKPRSLSHDYAIRSRARFRAAQLLFREGMYCDVVRECQEIVELLLKGYLRLFAIDPPKWHDVGPVLQQNSDLLSAEVQKEVAFLVSFSKELRKERENSFYGDVDMLPLDSFTEEQAAEVLRDTDKVIQLLAREMERE